MSTFDPVAFENMTIDQSNETKTTPLPEGDYRGLVSGVKIKTVKLSKGERAGQEQPVLEVVYDLEDPTGGKILEELNRDKIQVRQDIWLDVDNGTLAFGPNLNVQLGRLRDAVGQNKAGKPWAFKMLEGAGPVMVHVTHRTVNEDVYSQVSKISKPE